MQSEQTQPLQWIQERKQSLSQQRRHDLLIDAAFAVLMLCIGAALVLVALGG